MHIEKLLILDLEAQDPPIGTTVGHSANLFFTLLTMEEVFKKDKN